MGADCHGFFIEASVTWSTQWVCVATVHTDRDYTAFGVLAGVREKPPDYIAPRGYPANTSYAVNDHHDAGDCHSETWLTTNEMVAAQVNYMADFEKPATRVKPYLGLELAITIMRLLEERGEKEVRAVFCFDS